MFENGDFASLPDFAFVPPVVVSQMAVPRFKNVIYSFFSVLSNGANSFSIEGVCRRVRAQNELFSAFCTFANGIFSKVKAKRLGGKNRDYSQLIPWTFLHQINFRPDFLSIRYSYSVQKHIQKRQISENCFRPRSPS